MLTPLSASSYLLLSNLYKCGDRCAPMLLFSASFFNNPIATRFFGKLLASSFFPSKVS